MLPAGPHQRDQPGAFSHSLRKLAGPPHRLFRASHERGAVEHSLRLEPACQAASGFCSGPHFAFMLYTFKRECWHDAAGSPPLHDAAGIPPLYYRRSGGNLLGHSIVTSKTKLPKDACRARLDVEGWSSFLRIKNLGVASIETPCSNRVPQIVLKQNAGPEIELRTKNSNFNSRDDSKLWISFLCWCQTELSSEMRELRDRCHEQATGTHQVFNCSSVFSFVAAWSGPNCRAVDATTGGCTQRNRCRAPRCCSGTLGA